MTVVKVCGLRELPHMLAAAEAGADLLGMAFVPGVRRQVTPEHAREMARAFRETRGAQDPPASDAEKRIERDYGISLSALHHPGAPDLRHAHQNLVGGDLGISLGAGFALLWVKGCALVGLFADQPASDVNEIADAVGLDAVQLCGNEPPDYWAQIERPILKVVHVPDVPEGDAAARRSAVAALDERLRLVGEAGHLAMLDRKSGGQPGGTGQTFDWTIARELAAVGHRFLLAGGLTPENVGRGVESVAPFGVDVSSGVETDGVKDIEKIRAFVEAARGSEAKHV